MSVFLGKFPWEGNCEYVSYICFFTLLLSLGFHNSCSIAVQCVTMHNHSLQSKFNKGGYSGHSLRLNTSYKNLNQDNKVAELCERQQESQIIYSIIVP